MEASRFGFGDSLPPAYKFDPTDADIVAHYLLPRALGVPNEFEHAVIDDDTCSCPPWELLARHGHGGSAHAFFFGPPRVMEKNGGRMCRSVGDDGAGLPVGTWRGQKGEDSDIVLLRAGGGPGGAQMQIRCKRYNLTYYRQGDPRTTGWVMHEYHILEPKNLQPGAVLARIRVTDRARSELRKEKKRKAAAAFGKTTAAAAAAAPGPDQPGPSNYSLVEHDYDDAGATAASDDGEGTSSSGAQSEVWNDGNAGGAFAGGEASGYGTEFPIPGAGDGPYGFVGDGSHCFAGGYGTAYEQPQLVPGPDQPGPSNYLDYGHYQAAGNALVVGDGEGTSGATPFEVDQQGGGDMSFTPGYYTDCLMNGDEGGGLYYDENGGISAYMYNGGFRGYFGDSNQYFTQEDLNSCVNQGTGDPFTAGDNNDNNNSTAAMEVDGKQKKSGGSN